MKIIVHLWKKGANKMSNYIECLINEISLIDSSKVRLKISGVEGFSLKINDEFYNVFLDTEKKSTPQTAILLKRTEIITLEIKNLDKIFNSLACLQRGVKVKILSDNLFNSTNNINNENATGEITFFNNQPEY